MVVVGWFFLFVGKVKNVKLEVWRKLIFWNQCDDIRMEFGDALVEGGDAARSAAGQFRKPCVGDLTGTRKIFVRNLCVGKAGIPKNMARVGVKGGEGLPCVGKGGSRGVTHEEAQQSPLGDRAGGK